MFFNATTVGGLHGISTEVSNKGIDSMRLVELFYILCICHPDLRKKKQNSQVFQPQNWFERKKSEEKMKNLKINVRSHKKTFMEIALIVRVTIFDRDINLNG